MAEKYNIQKIAELASLKLNSDELPSYESHFEKILQYFKDLQKLDTVGIEPMMTPHQVQSNLREDRVAVDLSVDEILENAPDVKDSLFKVPPVV